MKLNQSKKEEEALTKLYLEHKKAMFGAAYSILNDVNAAEDAVQEAMLRLIRFYHRMPLHSASKTRAYILKVVKNTAKDIYQLRKQNQYCEINEDIEAGIDADPLSSIIERQGLNAIQEKISKLPKMYREVISLRYLSGYSSAQISETLKVSDEKVYNRISRGRKILKERLKEDQENG